MTKAVYIVRGIAATVTLCRAAAAHIRGSYEVLHGQVLAAATYEVLKQFKIYDFRWAQKIPVLPEYVLSCPLSISGKK